MADKFTCKTESCPRVFAAWQKLYGTNTIEILCPICGQTSTFTKDDTP